MNRVEGCAGTLAPVWPPGVEEIAAVFRSAGAEARLEELPEGESSFPGPAVRVDAVYCDGRLTVALVPADRDTDQRRLAAAARCRTLRPAAPPRFPYQGATVLIERLLFGERTVWIEAGSPRHVAALSPSQLMRLARAQPADLVAED
jgi:prolyl-tRNA editing enzyme YbaK/EbsC (Cys-tRNA(Pro) deacylase)